MDCDAPAQLIKAVYIEQSTASTSGTTRGWVCLQCSNVEYHYEWYNAGSVVSQVYIKKCTRKWTMMLQR